MADEATRKKTITITHNHADGTRILDSSKGDGVYELLRPFNVRPFRSEGCLGIPGSRDHFVEDLPLNRMKAVLEENGFDVETEFDNNWRPAAERYEDRAERSENRQAYHSFKAGKAEQESDAAYRARRAISGRIPFGQPILVGHHSERGHRRAIARMDALDRKSYEASDRAGYHAERAEASAKHEAFLTSPRKMERRIAVLETEIRQWTRNAAGSRHDAYRQRARLHIERDQEEIEYLRGRIARSGYVAWSKDNLAKDDYVRYGGTWYGPVSRLSKLSVSVARDEWPRTVPYNGITGRRRGAEQLDTPDGEPWPLQLAKDVAQWDHLWSGTRRDPHDDESRRQKSRVDWAVRLVHGLDVGAAPEEVEVYFDALAQAGVSEQRQTKVTYLLAYRQLAAGATVPQVREALALTPRDDRPAWRIPDDVEPVKVRVAPRLLDREKIPLLRVGDLLVGFYDRGFGGERLVRAGVGPVVDISKVRDDGEHGDWVTITLEGDRTREYKTHQWVAVIPAGSWKKPEPEPEPDIREVMTEELANTLAEECAGRWVDRPGETAEESERRMRELVDEVLRESGVEVGDAAR